MNYRVIKIGGSLFQNPDLPSRLNQWLQTLDPCTNILIAGGGELVDVVRKWDERFLMDPQTSHQLACQALRVTSTMLASWIEGAKLVTRIPEKPTDMKADFFVFDVADWVLQRDDIEASWDFTSDSIAAMVAVESHANELLLLKSALPNSPRVSQAVSQSYVDGWFHRIASSTETVAACTLDGGRVNFEFDTPRNDPDA